MGKLSKKTKTEPAIIRRALDALKAPRGGLVALSVVDVCDLIRDARPTIAARNRKRLFVIKAKRDAVWNAMVAIQARKYADDCARSDG